MVVRISIPSTLSHLTDGTTLVSVDGSDVRECLGELVRRFPDLERRLFEEDGRLNATVGVYVNLKSSFPNELGAAVKNGDEIELMDMITGG